MELTATVQAADDDLESGMKDKDAHGWTRGTSPKGLLLIT